MLTKIDFLNLIVIKFKRLIKTLVSNLFCILIKSSHNIILIYEKIEY